MAGLLGRILTRSFPGKGPEPGKRHAPVDKEGPDSAEQADYQSSGLALWLESLNRFENPQVIELGSLRPDTLAFLGQQGMRISVLGVQADGLSSIGTELGEPPGAASVQGALCWDLPNYLDAKGLRDLGNWLAAAMEPGGVVLLCLATKVPYPGLPGRYSIRDGSHLRYEPNSTSMTRDERYTNADLSKHMPGFELVRSFLLRNGQQEFVLRRRTA